MLREQEIYIQILNDHLNKKETIIDGNLDYEKLFNYAYSQNTNGIVYYQIKKYLPQELAHKLNTYYSNEIYLYTNRIYLYNLLISKLKEENINYYTVKGLDIARFYPIPALRTMGDSDIIVDTNDRLKVDKVFKSLGFIFEDGIDEWIYTKNNIQFELHDNLLYEDSSPTKEELAFISDVKDYVKDNILDINYHFIYLLLHLKKHILLHGVGFRQFMDLKVVIENNNLDMNWIDSKLKELNLLDFKETCLSLVNRWFTLNLKTKELDDEFYAIVSNKLFDGGVFGFDDEESKINSTTYKLSKNNNIFTRIKVFFYRFFPPFKLIKTEKDLSFFSNKPYLLPIAWIVRIYKSFKRGSYKKAVKDALNNTFVSNKKIEERNNYLNKWGI